jgi:hypothetical protein
MKICLNCEKSERQIPLLQMRYQGTDVYICPQCLPVLIHKPEKMAGTLPGMDTTKSEEHEH